MAVDQHPTLPVGLFIRRLGIPPFAFGIVLTANIDIDVVSFKVLTYPARWTDISTQAAGEILGPGNVGELIVEDDCSRLVHSRSAFYAIDRNG